MLLSLVVALTLTTSNFSAEYLSLNDAGTVLPQKIPTKDPTTGRKFEFRVKGQATDAGTVVSPREDLAKRLEVLRAAIETQSKKPTVLKSVLFATAHSPDGDAAMVLFDIGGTPTGLFFYYENGTWNIFPSDFTSK